MRSSNKHDCPVSERYTRHPSLSFGHQTLRRPRDFADTCISIAPRLAMIAKTVSGSKSDAEDIVQQAFTIALEKDQEFEAEGQFAAWLSVIVRNCALNHRRKSIRRSTFATDPLEIEMATSPAAKKAINQSTGELVPDQNSFDDQMITALNSMSVKARRCLLLRIIKELSYKEISMLMGISQNTAMSLVHRSKKQLHKALSEN